MSAPVDIDTIKDDLGIPDIDTANDAWLQRRIDGIWARFEQYCARPLQLTSGWVDDWGTLVTNHPAYTEPPLLRAMPSASVFLRVFPVQAVAGVLLNDQTVDPAGVIFEPESGRLAGLQGMACDLRTTLVTGRALIEYSAGFETLPPDLYEALLGVLGPLWAARSAQAGGLPGVPLRIATTDVGEIEFSAAPNLFVDATTKRGNVADPLLGPYAMLLDTWVDWRSMIGGAYPSTFVAVAARITEDGTPRITESGATRIVEGAAP